MLVNVLLVCVSVLIFSIHFVLPTALRFTTTTTTTTPATAAASTPTSVWVRVKVGYMVAACLLNETNEVLRLVINSVRNDIIGRNETAQCLALTMVANVGGKEFAESLAPDVMKLLVSASESLAPDVMKLLVSASESLAPDVACSVLDEDLFHT